MSRVSFLCIFFSAALAWAAPSGKDPCVALYQARRFAKAGACFARQAEKMSHDSAYDKILKARRLQSAALAFQRAAKQASVLDHKGFYFERAAHMFSIVLEQKLCRKKYRCLRFAARMRKLKKQVGYGTLVIKAPKARIEIRGFRTLIFRDAPKIATPFKRKMRPGTYAIKVLFPKAPKVLLKTLVLAPRARVMRSFKAPTVDVKVRVVPPRKIVVIDPPKPVKRGPSPRVVAAWIALAGGIALAMTGGVLTISGALTAQLRDSKDGNLLNLGKGDINARRVIVRSGYQELFGQGGITDQAQEAHDAAVALTAVGASLGSVGVASAVTGLVLLLLPTQKAKAGK